MSLPTQEPAKLGGIKPGLKTATQPQQVWSLLTQEQQQLIFLRVVRVCQNLIAPIPTQESNDE